MKKGSDSVLDLETKETSKATFSLSYLSEIIGAAAAIREIVRAPLPPDEAEDQRRHLAALRNQLGEQSLAAALAELAQEAARPELVRGTDLEAAAQACKRPGHPVERVDAHA